MPLGSNVLAPVVHHLSCSFPSKKMAPAGSSPPWLRHRGLEPAGAIFLEGKLQDR